MLVPIAIVGVLTGVAAWKVRNRRPKTMTPEREAIFKAALVSIKEPAKLRSLADEFEREGLVYQATILRKRAVIRELPKEKKLQRREIFKKAINSKNPEAIREVAAAFAGEGCFGAARDLNAHAESLLIEVIEEPDGSHETQAEMDAIEAANAVTAAEETEILEEEESGIATAADAVESETALSESSDPPAAS